MCWTLLLGVVSLVVQGLCNMTYVPNPQIALIDLLTSVGLKPDGIIGHSLGEVACGYADGCLSQREAVLAAYWRGQCIKDAHLPPGSMAAVGRCCSGSFLMEEVELQGERSLCSGYLDRKLQF